MFEGTLLYVKFLCGSCVLYLLKTLPNFLLLKLNPEFLFSLFVHARILLLIRINRVVEKIQINKTISIDRKTEADRRINFSTTLII
ncbi:hypothetical protein LEP1GSC137_2412 [Leptospira borgpetersenii str. Noumea 25]|nr:hypothetical protein LEP1GSC137_2412 [Leptospira borgpetersenii str. Noumea 25]